MKKLKVVQIGALHDHSTVIFESLKKQSDVFEILGYAIPDDETVTNPDSYKDYKRYSIEEVLNLTELDAVIIETGELNLSKYALMFLEKGIPVHMDKPGGADLEEFTRAISVAKQQNLVFHLGYMYRYNPEIIKILEDIKNGVLGEIHSIEAHMNCMHTPEKRQWLSNFKGGQMFFLGCHLIDLVYRILGKPNKVIPLNRSTKTDGVTAEDYGFAVFEYDNGISFVKTCANEPCGFMRRQLVICGSKGTVQLLPIEAYGENGTYTGVRKAYDDIFNWHADGEKYLSAEFDRYDTMMFSFAEYVNGIKENPYTYEYELELYKLILECCGI